MQEISLKTEDVEKGSIDLNHLEGANINDVKLKLKEVKLEKSNSDCIDTICAILLITFIVSIVIGCVCYYIFGIIYLVEDYDKAERCSRSNLWAYVLVSLILGLKNSKFTSNKDEYDNHLITLICLGLIDAGISIWGGIELFDNMCSDLKDSNLYTFGLVTFIVQVIFAGLTIFIIPISTFLLAICEK